MKPLDLLLTKEAFDEYAVRLRETEAKKYGLTLEQWDAAVLMQQTVNPNTQHNNNTQQTSSFSGKSTI